MSERLQQPIPFALRRRLSLLMFLQYAPAGAVLPMLSLHLEALDFTPREVGLSYATQSLASLVAPIVAGQIADRWVPSQLCVAVCSFISAGFIWLFASLTDFPSVFLTGLAFWAFMVPVLTLGTSLCFHQLAASGSEFGPVRLWGTVGWVAAVWVLSYWFDEPAWTEPLRAWLRPDDRHSHYSDMFRLAAVLSVVLGCYSLTLPHTPPAHKGGVWLAPLGALRLLRLPAFAVYLGIVLGIVITIPFSTQVTPLLLQYLGLPRPWLCRTLTIAQSSEILFLGLLPVMLSRIGTQRTMLIGLVGWTVALVIQMMGAPIGFVIGSLSLNGLCIGCFLVAGQVFINRHTAGDIRASTQALFTITTGLGNLIGNVLVGEVRYLVQEQFAATFAVAAVMAVILTGLFFAGFSEEKTGQPIVVEPETRTP